ncbi:DUF1654 domain-containing protein [Pseudomonas ovata]|uniref:DUF1654 domain-containing protein n=1 Tax=Pseudomonas ovata TaxID=1839709 RepID=UPI00137B511A|nr:DUF1654 domain-containing protein [Pseudomonas ovata]
MTATRPQAKALDTYAILLEKVRRIIVSPAAQRTQEAVISMHLSDRHEDWERLMTEISETDGLAITMTESGDACLTWKSMPE